MTSRNSIKRTDESMLPEVEKDKIGQVLVVEDNLLNQKVSSLLLEKLGYNVYIAYNGREAIDIIHNKSFDLILMDIHMPEMDGIEATKIIRNSKGENSDIPIIACSTSDFPEYKEQCLQVGMNDFISKPLDKKILKEVTEKYIYS